MCSLGMIRNSCFVLRMIEFYSNLLRMNDRREVNNNFFLMITFCNTNKQCVTASLRLFVMCFILISCVVFYVRCCDI